jgi:cytidylate kinase
MNGHTAIAIDGPSGAGKSTIARAAAKKFGFIYVDTGAIYRTVGLAANRAGIDRKDEAAVSAILPELDIEMKYDDQGEQRMILNGEDVSAAIRLPDISIAASDVSALPAVRAFLLDMQRAMAREHDVIMDGRDIGTVVLPDAELKIFLTASLEDRAYRRYQELILKGVKTCFENVISDIEKRDAQDESRAAAPLKPADDAVTLDTSGNTLEQSIAEVCGLIEKASGKKA